MSYEIPTEHGCVYGGPRFAMGYLQSMGVVDPGSYGDLQRIGVCSGP